MTDKGGKPNPCSGTQPRAHTVPSAPAPTSRHVSGALQATPNDSLWKYSGHTAVPYEGNGSVSLPASPKQFQGAFQRRKHRTVSAGRQLHTSSGANLGLAVSSLSNHSHRRSFDRDWSPAATHSLGPASPTKKGFSRNLPARFESQHCSGPSYIGNAILTSREFLGSSEMAASPQKVEPKEDSIFHLPYINHIRDGISPDTSKIVDGASTAEATPGISFLDTKTFFLEPQRLAYAGLCYLVMRRMAVFVNDSTALTAPASASYSAWMILVMNKLYSHLGIKLEERRVIEQLATHKVDIEEVAATLMPSHGRDREMPSRGSTHSVISDQLVAEQSKDVAQDGNLPECAQKIEATWSNAVSSLFQGTSTVPKYLVSTLFPQDSPAGPAGSEGCRSPSLETRPALTDGENEVAPSTATTENHEEPNQNDIGGGTEVDIRPILVTDLFLLLAEIRSDSCTQAGEPEEDHRVWINYDARARALVRSVSQLMHLPTERYLFIECWITEYICWAKCNQALGACSSSVKLVISRSTHGNDPEGGYSKPESMSGETMSRDFGQVDPAESPSAPMGASSTSPGGGKSPGGITTQSRKKTWRARKGDNGSTAGDVVPNLVSKNWLSSAEEADTTIDLSSLDDDTRDRNGEKRRSKYIETRRGEDVDFDVDLSERAKKRKKKRYVALGLATLGGGLILGLSTGFVVAPIIAPILGTGLTYTGMAGAGTFVSGAGGVGILTTTGVVTGGRIAQKRMTKRTKDVTHFELRPIPSSLPLIHSRPPHVVISVGGWLSKSDEDPEDLGLPFHCIDGTLGEHLSLIYEPEMLRELGSALKILASEVLSSSVQQILGVTALHAIMAALALPIALVKIGYLVDNPWSNGLDRSRLAGEILAECLLRRHRDGRPISFVAYSLGARVVWYCLLELQKRGGYGIVDSVFLFGNPVTVTEEDAQRVSSVVSGRLVNGFARNDWILGYLFRASTGGLSAVAGLTKIQFGGCANVENVDLTGIVNGHLMYRVNLPQVMRHVGLPVTLDEELISDEESDFDTTSAPEITIGPRTETMDAGRARQGRRESSEDLEGYTTISTGEERCRSATEGRQKQGKPPRSGFMRFFKFGRQEEREDSFIATTEWIDAEFKQKKRVGVRARQRDSETQLEAADGKQDPAPEAASSTVNEEDRENGANCEPPTST